MTTEKAFKYHPDAEYRFFIYDPEGNGFMYFRSAEDRDKHQGMVIDGYLDDGWDESVEQVVAGELTHTAQQVGREDRPPEENIDEEGCDGEGTYWGDFSYRCNYALLPLANEPKPLTNELEELKAELERLTSLIDTPHTDEWFEAVRLEAAHQIKRWGADHDAGKAPADWFWLLGYLGGKALAAAIAGNVEKAKHHTISSGAALLNWFRAMTGDSNAMRPGIDDQKTTT